MTKIMKCYYCKELINDKNNLELGMVGNRNMKFHKDTNCYRLYKDKKNTQLKNAEYKSKQYKEWSELYEYVKAEVLKYRPNMQLSEHTRRQLQGLKNGGIVTKSTGVSNNGYPYPIILKTFKLKKLDIDRALDTINFENENKKVNYIMAIIKNSINDIYIKVLEEEQRNKIINNSIIESPINTTKKVEYIKKSKINKGSLFDDIW